jgi:gas vesicle protein
MKEENKMNKDNAIGFGVGLLSGAIIGGVIALLYAPQSGKETRKMIKDKTVEVADTVKEKTMGVIDAVKEKTDGVVDMVKDEYNEVNRKGHAAVKALRS